MRVTRLAGTTDWAEYLISLPLLPSARQLIFGVLLAGQGELWADDLQLLVDDKPVWDAPRRAIPRTPLDADHEFDHGSKISINALSDEQAANLSSLARIWGFLKYFHPGVTSGRFHWDYELLRILPSVLAASDTREFNDILNQWVDHLGVVSTCAVCLEARRANLYMSSDLRWISTDDNISTQLRNRLLDIYRNRTADQFFVGIAPTGNALFKHELPYGNIEIPDSDFQLI